MTYPPPQPEPPLQSNLAFDAARPSQTHAPPPPAPRLPGADAGSGSGPVWFQRLSLFIQVLFCIYLGVIITALPWWTAIWDQNAFLLAHPHLLAVLRLGPVRGVISGLGLIDIWIGISEAVHYRESKPPAKLP